MRIVVPMLVVVMVVVATLVVPMVVVVTEVLVEVTPEMLMSVAGMTSVTLESASASPVEAPILTVTFGGLVRVPVVLAESALVLVVRVAEPSAVG
jgi:hypothetical protein